MNTYIIRSLLIASGFLLASINTQTLYANPDGGNVVAGSATINQAGNTVTVNQSTNTAIINWNGFSIGNGETTRFNQPNSNSIALNRVIGNDPSNIFGNLIANGKIMLINPNGIMFGSTSRVDVAGLIASTADISNTDFLAGNYKFSQNPNKNFGIVNNGEISVKDQGLVALVAPGVENNGIIRANLGKVLLASGTEFMIVDTYGDGLITFAANTQTSQKAQTSDGRVMKDAVANHGTIIADGGTVLMTARAAGNVVENVINMSGVIQANSVAQRNGQILLLGGEQGNVKVSGTFKAKGTQENKNGGFIETSGAKVNIANSVSVDTLGYDGGNTGMWLIDPPDYIIAASGGDMTGAQLSNLLNTGTTDITIKSADGTVNTNGNGNGNGNIFVNDAISWNSGRTLTLEAYNNININAPITITGTGKLVLDSGTGNSSGTVNFINKNHIQFSNITSATTGRLTINNSDYTLISNINQITDSNGKYALASSYTNNTNYTNSPIPTFSGTFNGLGNTITNLNITATNVGNLGLVGLLETGGFIENLGLIGGSVTGTSATVASYVGGLVGNNQGTLRNVYNTGNVSGGNNYIVGGLVGTNGQPTGTMASLPGVITQAYTTGTLTGNYVGGIAGVNYPTSSISNSYSSSIINSSNNTGPIGGIVGFNEGAINSSFYTGSITANGNGSPGAFVGIGGIVGTNYGGGINNAYNTGSITVNGDNKNVGGIAGYIYAGFTGQTAKGAVNNTYNIGNINVTGSNNQVGGIIGFNNLVANVVSRNYFINTGLPGIGGTQNGNGDTSLKTLAQLQQQNTFTNWNFSLPGTWGIGNYTNDGSNNLTLINNGLPYFQWQYPTLLITASSQTLTYNGSNQAGNLTYTITGGGNIANLVSGPALSVNGGNATNAGNYAITITAMPQVGYAVKFAQGTLTISKRTVVIDPTTGQTKTYGNIDPNLTYTLQAVTANTGLVNGDTLNGNISYQNAGQFTDAGDYAFTTGSLSNSNYNITLASNAPTFTITKRDVVVDPTAGQTKIYGNTDPTLTYSTQAAGANTGLVNGDTLAGNLSYQNADQFANAGDYIFTTGTLSNNNYNITLATNTPTFTITKRNVVVDPTAGQTKIYGNTDPTLNYSTQAADANTGLVNGDTLNGNLSYQNAGQFTDVGTYAITLGTLNNDNYNITLQNNTPTFSITKRTVVVDPTAGQTKTYGNVDPNLTYATQAANANTGLVNGDTLSGNISYQNAGQSTNVGTYAFTLGTLNNDNYDITLSNNAPTFAITKAKLIITANDASQFYNGISYSGGNGVTYSGFVNGDDISILNGVLSYIGNAQGATAAGSYTITPTNLIAANYEIIFVSGTLTIQPTADPNITFFNQNSLANRTNDNKNANNCTDNNLEDKTSSECKNLITVIEKPITKKIKHTVPHTAQTVKAAQPTLSFTENEPEDATEEPRDTAVQIVDGVAGYY